MVAKALKRPPFLGTWVAVLVLAGLGAYIYFVESKREGEPGEEKKEKVFAAFDRTKVEALTVSVAGEQEARLVREKDGWRMTAPLSVAADAAEADAVLSTLETLERDAVVAQAPSDPGEYGLAEPRATVEVRLQGAPAPLSLAVGDKTPDGSAVYARAAAAPAVFTVPAYVEGALAKKPFDLRDRRVLHVERDGVITIDVTGPEGAYALAKDAKGEWAFTRPLRTRAGRWSVDALVGTLEGMRMEAVAAEAAADVKPFGLAPPLRTVTVGLAGGGTRTLEVGSSPAEGRHHVRVAGSPLVAIVPGALVGDLAKGMGELRAKRLLEVATYEVEGFDVEAGGVKKAYSRTTTKDAQGADTQKWNRTAPDAAEVPTDKVQDALFAVGGIEVQEFVDAPQAPASYGLDAPALRVALRHAGGKPPAWFEVGSKDGAYYGRRDGDDAVMKLDAGKAAELITTFSF